MNTYKILFDASQNVLISKDGKYNDQYFTTAYKAYRAIGIDMYNYNFSKK